MALAADTVSITVTELLDQAVMLLVPAAMEAGLGSALFRGAPVLALAVALLGAGAGLPRVPAVPTPFAADPQVALWSRRTLDGCPVAAAAESRPASAGPATIADETGGTTHVGGP